MQWPQAVIPLVLRFLYWANCVLKPLEFAREQRIATNPLCGKCRSRGSADRSVTNQKLSDLSSMSKNTLVSHWWSPMIHCSAMIVWKKCGHTTMVWRTTSAQLNTSKERGIWEGGTWARYYSRKYNSECCLCCETLPENQQLFRMKVVRTFLQAGGAHSKLDHFRELLEGTGYRLSDKAASCLI